MADTRYYPATSTYPSPLKGFENLDPLPSDVVGEGDKSLVNPQNGVLSSAYEEFVDPLNKGKRGGFDLHIYYNQGNAAQTKYARELHERIRREFPELRIYNMFKGPIGPHPVAMFEVNVFTPAQFGAIVAWLAIWRGPLSVLIHPNSVAGPGEDGLEVARRDHTQRAIWMGERLPVDLDLFADMAAKKMDPAGRSAS
ncbi:hypothetical protein MAPG_07597 [Magnaporthiopsis poae ATCC 64411]|uniref:DOPA 4,5-dioxygenase n=1 Tax=Magnaporthiopsis poae (strain ATCC 64411 / 73-15) TaxID=644358 RepID=A0A0C4E536_MAGP6|nr:hypothetical protein MAPG_07597 [Magnaporthiopsis poae ATCC 64411]